MPQLSSIDKLPPAIRETIGKLRQAGWTIDQIREHLVGLYDQSPSRSALGRHIQGLDKLGEKLRRSRTLAKALASEMHDAPESTAARANIELLHSIIMDFFARAADGEDVDKEGAAALAGNPKRIQELAKAIESLANASKTNIEFLKAAEDRAAKKEQLRAVAIVETIAKKNGISIATVNEIKASIFGVTNEVVIDVALEP